MVLTSLDTLVMWLAGSCVKLIYNSLAKTSKSLSHAFPLYNILCSILLTDNDFNKADLVSSVQRDAYPKNQQLRAYHQKIDTNLGE